MATPVDVYYVAATKSQARSEGGGNHITLSTTDADALLVTSGDLVVCDLLCGVALSDYDAVNGEVTIDITGCHNLPVYGYVSGNIALVIGQKVYWSNGSSRIDGGTGGVYVGRLLATVGSGGPHTVPVKLNSG